MVSVVGCEVTAADERIYRILVENNINIHAEVIPRSRFRQMVEGSSADCVLLQLLCHPETGLQY
jgi:hypothetical protein